MASRTPRPVKFFTTMRSTNLTPSYPLTYEVHASTHHWRGELLEGWAAGTLNYHDVYQTENAFAYFKKAVLDLQKTTEPSQDIVIEFPPDGITPAILSGDDRAYYDAVALATSKGWQWAENFQENLLTGERKTTGGTKPFNLSLSTWEWSGRALGGSVGFSHFQRDGESKADLLLRILETAEKAKRDFPNSIPYTNIYGEIKEDEFKTRIVFGS